MKKSALLSLAAAVFFSAVPQLYAKGVFITPGTRANGMGAAYIAIADDPTAIYWNPAGLAQLTRSGIEFSMFYVKNSATSNTSLGNAAAPNPADGDFPLPLIYHTDSGFLFDAEPTEYASKNFETMAPVPFLAGYHVFERFTLAGGVYCSGGGGGKWEDTVSANSIDRIDASLDASFMFIVYNLSAAIEVMPRLSAGVGVDLVTMTEKQNAKKDYSLGAGSPLSPYSLEMDKQSHGSGIQYNGGILYRPLDTLRFGAVIKSGTNISLTGTAKFDRSGLALLGAPDVQFKTDYDQNYTYPLTCGFGVSYDPLPKWTLAAGLDFNQYSMKRDDTSYKTPLTNVYESANTDGGWKDTTQYRAGAEYRHNEKLPLRAGFQNDPSQLRDDNLTLINLDQYDMVYYTIGAGYNFSFATVDLTLGKGYSEKLAKAGRSYEYNIDIIRAGINYAF